MRTLYFLVALVLLPTFLFSQKAKTNSQTILQIETGFASPRFYIDNERVTKGTFGEYLKINPEAYSYFNKGNRRHITESVFGFIGGVVIAKGIVSTLSNKVINFKPIGVGACFFGIGSLIHLSTNQAYNKAMRIYRDDNVGDAHKPKLQLGVSSDGVGFVVGF